MALEPDGVFLSNGPGDPAALPEHAAIIAELLGPGAGVRHLSRPPAAGRRRIGARTYKLPFGHHGGNHPVRRLDTGQVEITSQNHNYAVDGSTLPTSGPFAAEVTHVNLNDGVVEGFRCTACAAFSVQYHPEAGPGPHDAALPVRAVPAA